MTTLKTLGLAAAAAVVLMTSGPAMAYGEHHRHFGGGGYRGHHRHFGYGGYGHRPFFHHHRRFGYHRGY